MSAVTTFKDFNPATVKESSNVRHLDTGGKMVWLSHTGSQPDAGSGPIILQTSQMRSPNGIRGWENEGAPTKYSMELVLDPAGTEYKKLLEFDQKILDIACNTKNKWIKKASKEVLDALYNPTVRVPRDKETDEVTDKWPVTFKLTIPQRDGGFVCELWDNKRKMLDVADFIKSGSGRNCLVTVIAQCTGIWVAGGKFGTTWKAQQILVHSSSNSSLQSFAFIGGSDMIDSTDDADGDKRSDEDDDEAGIAALQTARSASLAAASRAATGARGASGGAGVAGATTATAARAQAQAQARPQPTRQATDEVDEGEYLDDSD